MPSRKELIEKQKSKEFDIIVIGGGITGAGVARDAVLRGLDVALVEKEDFSSGTSSQSSKLLHGGLRYLKNFEFGLVREAALERKKNLEIAPHLGEIKDFLVPMYKWSDERPILLRLGLWLYDLLAIPKNIGRHKWLSDEKLVQREPLLANEDLKSGGMYQDVIVHDSRLTLENILSAINEGAAITNYTKANTWENTNEGVKLDVTDMTTGSNYELNGKILINCTGPWTEIMEGKVPHFQGKAELRPTWGAHLVLKKKTSGYPILIVNKDGRAVFLLPHEDFDIAGTTDIDYSGDPDDIAPTEHDRDYLLEAINNLFPGAQYKKEDVIAAFSGLRPLVAEKGVPEGEVSRDHEIFTDDTGIITVAGGKLTTYRIMAKEAVNNAVKMLGLKKRDHKCQTAEIPLFGGDIELDEWNNFLESKSQQIIEDYEIDNKTAENMLKHYGSRITELEQIIDEHGSAKLKPNRPWMEAQVIYSCRFEYICTPVDFLRRRTWIMFEEENGLDILDRVIELMTDELNWDEETKQEMEELTQKYVSNFIKIQPTGKMVENGKVEKLTEISST